MREHMKLCLIESSLQMMNTDNKKPTAQACGRTSLEEDESCISLRHLQSQSLKLLHAPLTGEISTLGT